MHPIIQKLVDNKDSIIVLLRYENDVVPHYEVSILDSQFFSHRDDIAMLFDEIEVREEKGRVFIIDKEDDNTEYELYIYKRINHEDL